ncbi:DUF4097 family beta strand repeat protein [Cellulomonas sp. zg-ZUI222]|uniref:DUF4097 family beta strand repeat protein n=1 Tax=Cellulomonas wangleii TaxID=2816956 RepID=A0ABX8DBE1_9CELL|nr:MULTISPECIES: DUF4097 family beta strand repeat-containing protein [Cellulomonas]MBO0900973.1 DUF4097 family beta strand repeat protein [Cellulomonas sp. zg-ZUI22]MBO0921628.1 DUF4097 family beta strand repeat protein [Cellulomonas wangleii]MBO0925124.1 DUF4097 family beta strand repeat protein [Cellulomonas wangleii]QVI63467.1 DUF4097 family beta strand repeat protein [Cellulomonas wangleii]
MSTESWVVAGPQVIEIEDLRALRVGLVGGRVDVVAHDDPEQRGARLEVHEVDGRPLEVTLSDGELRVGYSFTLGGWEGFVERFRNFQDKDRADVHIAVPSDVLAKVGTVSADELVAGLRQDVSVSTVSGSVVVDDVHGRLSTTSVSGETVVRRHQGDVRFNTVSGEFAASGELTLVQGNSVSGAVSLDVGPGTSSLTVTTVAGDLTVRVPEGAGLSVRAQSVSGRLVVDGQEHKGTGPGRRTVDLDSGDGGTYLSATTVTGHVTVLRAPVDDAVVDAVPGDAVPGDAADRSA